MDHERVSQAVYEIEQGLVHDDPGFVRHFEALHRSEIATVVTVALLLAIGAVFLTLGFATSSLLPWGVGLVAFLLSFAVDEHHKHILRRNP